MKVGRRRDASNSPLEIPAAWPHFCFTVSPPVALWLARAGSVHATGVSFGEDDKMPPAAKWGDGVGPNGKKMLQNWQTDGYPD